MSKERREREPTSLKLLVFDLDGVVFDSERGYFEAKKAAFEEFGSTKEYTIPYHLSMAGISNRIAMAQVVKDFELSCDIDELIDVYRTLWRRHVDENGVPLVNGIKELFSELERNGIRRAAGTGGGRESTMLKLEKAGLRDAFEHVVTSDDVPPDRGKPKPDIFLEVAKRSGVVSSECLVIGDSVNDVIASREAGMGCFYYSPGFSTYDLLNGHRPDRIVPTLRTLRASFMRRNMPQNTL